MKITGPLVVDVSDWVDHLDTQKFIDGGVQSVIVGFYQDRSGPKPVLSKKSRQHAQAVAKSGLLLMAYLWDDIILDPVGQADWAAETLLVEGLPVKAIFGDQEQWWTNWSAYNNWRAHQKTVSVSTVPRASAANISWHNEKYMATLAGNIPDLPIGLYCNKNFIASYTNNQMDKWISKYLQWPSHYGRQPATATKMTWEQLKAQWLPNYDIILSAAQAAMVPQMIVGHQFTGDACILPGSENALNQNMALDVSVFRQEFIDGLKGTVVQSTPATKPCPMCGGTGKVPA
jgi:hypothetical protein